jgi:hypothetical protein
VFCMNGIRCRTSLLYKTHKHKPNVVYVSSDSKDCSLHKVKQVMTNSGVKWVDAWKWEEIILPEFACVVLHVKPRTLWYRSTCLVLLNGASQSGEPPQVAGILSIPRGIENFLKSEGKTGTRCPENVNLLKLICTRAWLRHQSFVEYLWEGR